MLVYRGSLPCLAGRDCRLGRVAFDRQSLVSHTLCNVTHCAISVIQLTQVEPCYFTNVRAELKIVHENYLYSSK